MKYKILAICLFLITKLFSQDVKIQISCKFDIDSVFINEKKVDYHYLSDSSIIYSIKSNYLFEGEILSIYSKNRIYSTTLSSYCVTIDDTRENNLELSFELKNLVIGRLNGSSKFSGMPLMVYSLDGDFIDDESFGICVKND